MAAVSSGGGCPEILVLEEVNIEKVKAHEKKYQKLSLGNNMADLLAKNGRAKFYER